MAAQTQAKATAAPRKRATATKATAAKPAAPSTEDKAAPAEVDVVVFDCDQLDDTKSYSVFQPPASSGCVGKLYVPHGVTEVRVKLTGPSA